MWTESAQGAWRALLGAAAAEATRRGDRRLGTDHLVLGLLAQPGGSGAAMLGTNLECARGALDDLDAAALRAVGVCFATSAEPLRARRGRARLALSSGARGALARASALGPRVGARADTESLLLALLETELPDPAAQLLDRLGVDRERCRAQVIGAAARKAI